MKRIESDWETCFSEESRDEFVAELREDEDIVDIRVYKTGEGWLVEYDYKVGR